MEQQILQGQVWAVLHVHFGWSCFKEAGMEELKAVVSRGTFEVEQEGEGKWKHRGRFFILLS